MQMRGRGLVSLSLLTNSVNKIISIVDLPHPATPSITRLSCGLVSGNALMASCSGERMVLDEESPREILNFMLFCLFGLEFYDDITGLDACCSTEDKQFLWSFYSIVRFVCVTRKLKLHLSFRVYPGVCDLIWIEPEIGA